MMKVDLNGVWELTGRSPEGEVIELEAAIPGCALNDVVKADGVDIFYRDNADKYLKYERYSWVYKKVFEIEETDDVAVLNFERLDTYCDIYLNDKHVAYSDNGNMAHSFDISKFVKQGENVIEIHFYSPVVMTDGKKPRPAAFTNERLYTRRPQCTYGWDWTMRFVTCGMGNVYVSLDKKRMYASSVYVYTCDADEESATVGIDIDLENYENGGYVEVEISDKEGDVVYHTKRYSEEDFVRLHADIPNAKLWYPLGYGEQYLYTLKISVDGREDYAAPFGIRTVKIMQLPDAEGTENYNKCRELKKTEFSEMYDKNESFSGFILKINGIKIMCKGANWVPCMPFNMGSTDEKITQILETSAEAGVNMIRVWGGGAFETSHFYDECSRLGILVTQDFLMACGAYPEDEAYFLEHLRKEARYAALHLRNKTCLVWWSGDNENAINGCDTDVDYRGRASAYKAIAPVLYKMDFARRFLPSSPFGGANYASNTVGTTHNTQFLDTFFNYMEQDDLSDYKDVFKRYNARFIAEETCFGAVKRSTLEKFMTADDIVSGDDTMWKYHTKSNPGLKHELFEYFDMFTEKVLGKYKSGDDRYFKLKYMQYEWIRVSMERTRREKWFCSGVIYWMLNDCWPAASGWAIIDYNVQPKAAYYSFKRAAKPVILSVDSQDGVYKIYLCNDKCEEKKYDLVVYGIDNDGKIAERVEYPEVTALCNDSHVVAELDGFGEYHYTVAEVRDENGIVDRAFYRKGTLDIDECGDTLSVTHNGNSLKIKADRYIHAVEIECDGRVSDNYFSMLPGEEIEVFCDTEAKIIAYK